VEALLPARPKTAGVLLLHGIAEIPMMRVDLPVQVHVANPDMFFPAARVAAWEKAATRADAAVQLFTYPGVGHFFIDEAPSDHDEASAALAWARTLSFLARLRA